MANTVLLHITIVVLVISIHAGFFEANEGKENWFISNKTNIFRKYLYNWKQFNGMFLTKW